MSDGETQQSIHPVPMSRDGRRRWAPLLMVALFLLLIVGLAAFQYRQSKRAELAAPLFVAVKQNQVSKVGELLKEGADPNTLSLSSDTRRIEAEPLTANPNLITQVKSLLKKLVHRQDPKEAAVNPPVLVLAVENNNKPIVHALLEARADPNIQTEKGASVLRLAAREADLDIIKELVQRGAQVNPTDTSSELTPLQWALRRDDVELATFLLEAGTKVDVTDEQGRTPLLQAASNGDLRLVNTLLKHGASVHARNKFGLTALKIAEMDGREDIRQALERAGATE